MRSLQLYFLNFLEFTTYSILLVLALIILLKKLGSLGSVIFLSAIHSGNPLKVKMSVALSCPTLYDPMNYPDSSVHGISQARIL